MLVPLHIELTDAVLYYYRAKVERVVDGDTIIVEAIDVGFGLQMGRTQGHPRSLRVLGVDTPEIRGEERPQGLAAKAYVDERIKPEDEIIIKTVEVDNFGRWLAHIWYAASDGSGWRLLAQDLLDDGHAEPSGPLDLIRPASDSSSDG